MFNHYVLFYNNHSPSPSGVDDYLIPSQIGKEHSLKY